MVLEVQQYEFNFLWKVESLIISLFYLKTRLREKILNLSDEFLFF